MSPQIVSRVMLSFDIRSLEAEAVTVDESLPATDSIWQEGDQMPLEPVRVTGRRCLVETTLKVSDEAHIIFAPAGTDDADDPDVYPYNPRDKHLDLRPVVRELWLLNKPMYALCRDDCR